MSREDPQPRRRKEAFRDDGKDQAMIGQLRRKQRKLADKEHGLEMDLEKVGPHRVRRCVHYTLSLSCGKAYLFLFGLRCALRVLSYIFVYASFVDTDITNPPPFERLKIRERLGVVDATVELWLRRSQAMLAKGGSETDTDMLQVIVCSVDGSKVKVAQFALEHPASIER